MNTHENNILKLVKSIYSHNTYDVFADFVQMSALSIKQSADLILGEKKSEEEFQKILERYQPKEQQILSDMFGELVDALEEHFLKNEICDTLGAIFGELSINNKNTGQFFTPASVAELCGTATFDSRIAQKQIEEKGYILVNEPSCGGGVMLMAFIQAMMRAGFNPQKHLLVVAQDIDRRCVCMTYLQLSLYGIPGKVIHGNTLTLEEYEKPWVTPIYAVDLWALKERRAKEECCQKKNA